jgi:hypothetical protein
LSAEKTPPMLLALALAANDRQIGFTFGGVVWTERVGSLPSILPSTIPAKKTVRYFHGMTAR